MTAEAGGLRRRMPDVNSGEASSKMKLDRKRKIRIVFYTRQDLPADPGKHCL